MSGAAFGLAAMDQPLEEFTDYVMTKGQAAKTAGVAVSTFDELVRLGQGPVTLWAEDVRRWAAAQRAGEPGRRRR
ncbi:hypothetical protein [Microlunatus antarcticus]|uniref:Uncharacterized protein n=1 Tax=Microlunatus antarcticus TaxID=53388 RepID=A0A7W5P5N9_9ACTN|nr:hypothetical protein [Microlunatus antarcticus]MBB3325492.1 hypothetical protein [Microlunatus antarcticus]